MDQQLFDRLVAIMTSADLPLDSSEALAFHIAQHYPEHGAALLGDHTAPEAPPTEEEA